MLEGYQSVVGDNFPVRKLSRRPTGVTIGTGYLGIKYNDIVKVTVRKFSVLNISLYDSIIFLLGKFTIFSKIFILFNL